jgi:hypothetical protein
LAHGSRQTVEPHHHHQHVAHFSSMIGYEISRMLTLDQTPPNTADVLWKEGEKNLESQANCD